MAAALAAGPDLERTVKEESKARIQRAMDEVKAKKEALAVKRDELVARAHENVQAFIALRRDVIQPVMQEFQALQSGKRPEIFVGQEDGQQGSGSREPVSPSITLSVGMSSGGGPAPSITFYNSAGMNVVGVRVEADLLPGLREQVGKNLRHAEVTRDRIEAILAEFVAKSIPVAQ